MRICGIRRRVIVPFLRVVDKVATQRNRHEGEEFSTAKPPSFKENEKSLFPCLPWRLGGSKMIRPG
jgi:hypothetical protein